MNEQTHKMFQVPLKYDPLVPGLTQKRDAEQPKGKGTENSEQKQTEQTNKDEHAARTNEDMKTRKASHPNTSLIHNVSNTETFTRAAVTRPAEEDSD